MKALLENEIVSLYTNESALNEFEELMKDLLSADAGQKCKIENSIVSAGMKFVPQLIEQVQSSKGVMRGVCAMSLIRIGSTCANLIKEAARMNRDFAWAANYILNEMQA